LAGSGRISSSARPKPVARLAHQPINQPTNQPTHPPTKPINQQTDGPHRHRQGGPQGRRQAPVAAPPLGGGAGRGRARGAGARGAARVQARRVRGGLQGRGVRTLCECEGSVSGRVVHQQSSGLKSAACAKHPFLALRVPNATPKTNPLPPTPQTSLPRPNTKPTQRQPRRRQRRRHRRCRPPPPRAPAGDPRRRRQRRRRRCAGGAHRGAAPRL